MAYTKITFGNTPENPDNIIELLDELRDLILTREALKRYLDLVSYPQGIKGETRTASGTALLDIENDRKARIEGVEEKFKLLDERIWDLLLATKT